MSANTFSGRPLYLQVRDALAERIAAGAWKPGAALPNESDLAQAFGVGVATMRRALQTLEKEGVLGRRGATAPSARQQVGQALSCLSDMWHADVGENCTKVTLGPVSSAMASSMEVARLGLQDQRKVHRIQRVRCYRDRPFMIETVSVPAHLFPDVVSRMELAADISLMAEHHGLRLGKAEERAHVACADLTVAQALGIASGTSVLVLDRMTFAGDGRAVEWRVGHCHFAHMANAGI
jgi:GntR family transcriptional regulator